MNEPHLKFYQGETDSRKKEHIATRIELDLYQEIDFLAECFGTTRSKMLRTLIKRGLKATEEHPFPENSIVIEVSK